jgi:hypothetical protein
VQVGKEAVAAPEHSTVVSSCPVAGKVVRTPSGAALVGAEVVPVVAVVVGMHYKRGFGLC